MRHSWESRLPRQALLLWNAALGFAGMIKLFVVYNARLCTHTHKSTHTQSKIWMLLKYNKSTNNRFCGNLKKIFTNNVKPLKVFKRAKNYLWDCICYFQDSMLQRAERKFKTKGRDVREKFFTCEFLRIFHVSSQSISLTSSSIW